MVWGIKYLNGIHVLYWYCVHHGPWESHLVASADELGITCELVCGIFVHCTNYKALFHHNNFHLHAHGTFVYTTTN